VRVEVSLLDILALKEQTFTENVSAHGTQVLSKRELQPLQQAVQNGLGPCFFLESP